MKIIFLIIILGDGFHKKKISLSHIKYGNTVSK